MCRVANNEYEIGLLDADISYNPSFPPKNINHWQATQCLPEYKGIAPIYATYTLRNQRLNKSVIFVQRIEKVK